MEEVLNNINTISSKLQQSLTKSQVVSKIDGITLQCQLKTKRTKFETAKEEIQQLCSEYDILPVSLEQNEQDKTLFALQFPELNVLYTAEELQSIYIDFFKWLLDNAIEKTKMNVSGLPTNITKQLLLNSVSSYTKMAISIFCKNYINPYKQNENMYLSDSQYIKQIENIYIDYIDTYCQEKGIK